MAKAEDDDDEWKVVRRRGRRSAVPAGGRAAGASGARVMNNFAAIAPAGAEDWHGDGDGDGDGDARSSGKTEEERARRRAKKKKAAARARAQPRTPPPTPAPAPGPGPGPRDARRRSLGGRALRPALAPREVDIADEPRGDTTDRARASDADVVRVGGLIALVRAVVAAFAALLRVITLGAFQLAPSKPRSDDDSDDAPTTTRRRRGRSPRSIPPRTRPRPPPRNRRTVPRNRRTVPRPPPRAVPGPRPGPVPGPVPAARSLGRVRVRASERGRRARDVDAREGRSRSRDGPRGAARGRPAGDPRSIGELARCCAVQGDAIVVGGWDGTVRRWRWTRDGSALVGGAPLQGHSDKVEFASASPIVFGDGDGRGTRDRGDGRSRLVSDHVGSVPRVSRGRETRARTRSTASRAGA